MTMRVSYKRFYSGLQSALVLILCLSSSELSAQKNKTDSLQFAPGYPAYSVSQLDQLESFPLPRFKPGTNLRRNFSWYDFLFLGYDYTQAKEKDGKFLYPGWNAKAHADAAVKIDEEMYRHWNYYFSIATPTYNYNFFTNPNTIAGAQAKYANDHPDVKVCTYVFWSACNPSKAGFGPDTKAHINKNVNIDPCGDTTYPGIAIDGLTEKFYLEKLVKVLPARDPLKKIDFVNENGEKFGESWTPNAEGYRGNKFISCIQPDSVNARAMRAAWQYKVFNTYKKQFIGNDSFPALKNTDFSFYQVAGFLPYYYSEWTEMRKINSSFHGSYYSTPDFYPGQADHSVFERYSFYHGLDCISEGRKYEIANGDAYFSPFICAGWFADSLNYRPAAWLAATKALAMMGAEFYYPAYFNTGNFSAHPPGDPKGYVYQVAIPAYAQAITSRYEKIFFDTKTFTYTRKNNSLVIYRKDTTNPNGPVYAVSASVFSPANQLSFAAEKQEWITIDGDQLKIDFRPQGSTYIYDKRDPANILFYQLDSWQEASHPYYWSKDFLFEAEVSDDTMQVQLHTELPSNAKPGDYTQFTTYVSFANASITHKQLSFHFEPRKDTGYYYVWVRARSVAKDGSPAYVKFSLDGNTTIAIGGIQTGEFQWYCFVRKGESNRLWVAPDVEHELRLIAADRNLELDKILLSESPKKPE